MLRDRRVVTGAFVGPVVLLVVLIMLIGALENATKDDRATTLHAVYSADAKPALIQAMEQVPNLKLVPIADEAQGRKLLEEGDAKVVLVFGEDFDAKLKDSGQAPLKALYDEREPRSMLGLAMVREIVGKTNEGVLKGVLQAQGLPPGTAEPIKLEPTDVGKDQPGAASLASLLPYLIVLWAFYGGMSIVADMVAGEKERGTLETLLISPVSRSDIAIGKFLALSLVCLASSLATLISLIVVAALRLPAAATLFPDGFSLSLTQVLAIFAVLLPLVAMFAALLLAVSAWAKNMREAQTYLTLISFIVIIPAIFSQFIGFTDLGQSMVVRIAPVLNTAVVIREALLGKIDLAGLGITVAVSLALAALAIWWSVRMFTREQVVART